MKKNKNSKSGDYPTIDLHGCRVDEVDLKIDRFLRKCDEIGAAKTRIITGKGTGAVREQTVKYLKLANYPWKTEPLSNGGRNPGSLIIFLD